MNRHWTKPGFELIFALSIIGIMTLPLLVFAQGNKNMDITIMNGDTTINGKNIKELSPAEREQALKDIDNLSGPETNGRQHIVLRKRSLTDTGRNMIYNRRFFNDDDLTENHRFFNDSAKHVFKFRMRRPDGGDSTFTFNYRMNGDGDRNEFFNDHMRNFNFRMRERENFRHRNVQRFDYTNTGNDGISTHTSFRVSDASPEKVKNVTGSEKADLELRDLNLVPEFSSGKTLLMFNLASKTAAEVKFTDSEGKLIWSEKMTAGEFSKSFPLGLNGVYFLQVKQGSKVALKRVVKED
ncbi:MAG TPA: T9SS type A sorting domain-containing protein [Mucilaginibacter sp.]